MRHTRSVALAWRLRARWCGRICDTKSPRKQRSLLTAVCLRQPALPIATGHHQLLKPIQEPLPIHHRLFSLDRVPNSSVWIRFPPTTENPARLPTLFPWQRPSSWRHRWSWHRGHERRAENCRVGGVSALGAARTPSRQPGISVALSSSLLRLQHRTRQL